MKKIVRSSSFLLALLMVFSVFAGAAYPTGGYADQSQISSLTIPSVQLMGELNIMYGSTKIVNGVTGTYFSPTQTLTRAQIARIIYTLETGKDSADLYKDAVHNPFNDVPSNHWALGFINYCYIQGYLSGKSATRFDPDGKLKLSESMTTLLAFMGYEKEDLAKNWPSNVVVYGVSKGLFENGVEENVAVGAALQRQWCSVVIANALQCTLVEKNTNGTYRNTTTTVMQAAFPGFNEKTGVVAANDRIAISGSPAAEGNIRLADGTVLPYAADNSLVGKEVDVKYSVKGSVTTVLSVSLRPGFVSYSTTAGGVTFTADGKISFPGHSVKYTDAEVAAFVFFISENSASSIANNAALKTYIEGLPDCSKLDFTLSGGKIKLIHVTPYYFTKITALTGDKVTGTGLSSTTVGTLGGAVKDDYIAYHISGFDGKLYGAKVSPSTVTVSYVVTDKLYVGGSMLTFAGAPYNLVPTGAPANATAAAAFAGKQIQLYSYNGTNYMMKSVTQAVPSTSSVIVTSKTVRTYGAGKIVTEIKGISGSQSVTYLTPELAGELGGALAAGDVITVTLNTEGKLTAYAPCTETHVKGAPTSVTVNGSLQILAVGGVNYIVTGDTQIVGVNADYSAVQATAVIAAGKQCVIFYEATTKVVSRIYAVQ